MNETEIIDQVEASFAKKNLISNYDYVVFSKDFYFLSLFQYLAHLNKKTVLSLVPNDMDLQGLIAVPKAFAQKLNLKSRLFQYLESGSARHQGFHSFAVEEILYGANEDFCLVDKLEMATKMFKFDSVARAQRAQVHKKYLQFDSGYGKVRFKNYINLSFNQEDWIYFDVHGFFPLFFRDELVWYDGGLVFVFTRISENKAVVKVKIFHWLEQKSRANWSKIIKQSLTKIYPYFRDLNVSLVRFTENSEGLNQKFPDILEAMGQFLGDSKLIQKLV